MKKLTYFLFVLFSLSFIACSSDDNSSGGEDDNLYIRFTANEQQYNFEPETITSLQRLIMGDEDVNDIYTRVSLWMPVIPTTGSYSITNDTPNDENLETLYNAELWIGDDTYVGSSGTLIVTEVGDEYVKGTFSFTGTNEAGTAITVTNGSFRAYR